MDAPPLPAHAATRDERASVPMTDTDLPPLPDTPTGLYRHHKGGAYEVLGVVRHSETLRPHAMFFGTVLVHGHAQPRFAFVSPDLPPP